MQPYFLPYLGYWQLLNAVDKYVIYDDVNYIKGGWIPRNRILIYDEPQFIRLKLSKTSSYKRICDLTLNDDYIWRDKMLKTINMAYHKAPYFNTVYEVMQKIVLYPERNLADFLIHSIKMICEFLKIETELIRSSDLIKDNTLRGEGRVIDICQRLGASIYYNAIGGRELYHGNVFQEKGIKLYFLRMNDISYTQLGNRFTPGLSILDVMMFNKVEKIFEMLQEYSIESAIK